MQNGNPLAFEQTSSPKEPWLSTYEKEVLANIEAIK